ncbi:MAG: hypothetical protein HUJ84_07075, partial [Veillonella sp.]|nr:hypothetical protein [Veillonella sp.]
MTEEQRQRLAALKAQVKNKQPDMTDKIIVTTYTDPACIWCWRMEPVLRRLEAHWGNQWILRTVMG